LITRTRKRHEKIREELQAQIEHNVAMLSGKEASCGTRCCEARGAGSVARGDRDPQVREGPRLRLYQLYLDQAKALRDLAAAKRTGGSLADSIKDFKEQFGALDSLGKQIWDDLWQGGSSVFKRLGQTLKRELLDELYKLVAKPFIIQLAAQFTGTPLSAAMNAAGANGTGGSILSALGFGNSASGGSYSLSGIGDSIAGFFGGGSGIGGAAITSGEVAATADATAAALAGAGASAGEAAAAAGALGESMAGASAAAGTFGAGMTAALAAVPVVGWIAAGAALIAAFAGGGGGPKTESGYGAGVPQRGDASAATSIAQNIQGTYASVASALGLNATLQNLAVFFAKDPQGTAQTQLQITGGSYDRAALTGGGPLGENVGRSDAEFEQAVALASTQLVLKNLQDAAGGKVGDFLKSIDITSASLDTMQHALQVAQDVGNFSRALAGLGPQFQALRDLSIDNTEALAKASGGYGALTAGIGNFFDKAFSTQEKAALIQQQLTDAFQTAGVVLPKTLDEYKAAVLDAEQHVDSEEGRKAFTTLIQNFDSFYQVAQSAGDAITGVGSALSGAMQGLQADAAKLNVELLRAQGDQPGATSAQRAIDTAG
jgi:hypothetical protein